VYGAVSRQKKQAAAFLARCSEDLARRERHAVAMAQQPASVKLAEWQVTPCGPGRCCPLGEGSADGLQISLRRPRRRSGGRRARCRGRRRSSWHGIVRMRTAGAQVAVPHPTACLALAGVFTAVETTASMRSHELLLTVACVGAPPL
jgi:hypothetical protein